MPSLRRTLPFLILAACSGTSAKNEEPLLTEEQNAELQRIVDRRMAAVASEVSLSDAQRESIRPVMDDAKRKFILASRSYRADPTPRNMDKYQAKMRELGLALRKDLQPFMTNAQLNQFLVVVDQVIQDVRAARPAPG